MDGYQRRSTSGIGISFVVALALGFVPPTQAAGDELAGAKRLLATASQSPELAELSRTALQIGTELERISGELARLKTANASKYDSRYAGITRTLEDLRLQLTALKTQANKTPTPAKAHADNKSGASQDRRKAALDAIQKMLDIIRSMNPKV